MPILTHALAFAFGGSAVWIALRPRLDHLRRLTDRDPKTGRFWKAPGE